MYKIDYNKIFPKNIKELNTIFLKTKIIIL